MSKNQIHAARLPTAKLVYYFGVESISSSSSSSSPSSSSSSVFYPRAGFFTENSGTKPAVLLKGRSSIANSGTKVAVFLRVKGAVASRCFPHPTLYLASELILKDLRRSQGHQLGGEESGFC